METCTNCDVAAACYRCAQCSPHESLFCETCMGLHKRIKPYREHTFDEYQRKVLLCSNCDTTEAKFACRQCEESVRYLCVGCSVIHPKIKQFRGHHVVAMQTEQSAGIPFRNGVALPHSLSELSAMCASAIDVAYYNFTNLAWTDVRLWQTMALLLAVTLSYYAVVRLFFLKYSSLVNIAVAIGLYQWFQSTKLDSTGIEANVSGKSGRAAVPGPTTTLGGSSLSAQVTGIFGSLGRGRALNLEQFNEEDFKDEFWYSLESKRASLRPRVRPYSRKSTGRSAPGAGGPTEQGAEQSRGVKESPEDNKN